MKHIIKFSLDRRFKNKVTIILHVLVIGVLSSLLFMDKIIEFIFVGANDKELVYYDPRLKETFENVEDELFILKEGEDKEKINIKYEEKWILESPYTLDPIVSINLRALITNTISEKWLETLSDESIYSITQNISPEITERTISKTPIGRDKMNMSMFLITGIYFAMLSFSTMIANEVVYEKTSRVLDIILTSVTTTTHYFSKMIVAWLTVMLQISTILFEGAILLYIRNAYDEGSGLLKILTRYNLLEVEATTFKSLLKVLGIDQKLLSVLGVSMIYMLLGVVIVQMIMVCISSFINSIEESGAIQAPVYIIFLIVYYVALALNAPAKLSSGFGYYMSMTPIVSMLFMPMRLLLVEVSIHEILLGIVLNICTLIIFSYYGSKIYHYGILGGVSIKRRRTLKKTNK